VRLPERPETGQRYENRAPDRDRRRGSRSGDD
jgi:hypothetical protein